MNNALVLLRAIDSKLTQGVELTLYGRAALVLGFENPLEVHALSRDIDAVLWTGQAEELNERTNFWPAVEEVNEELADQELFISHFFTEDQVILMTDWLTNRIRIPGDWARLVLYRLGDLDLLLSKLMRDDPIDLADALFIVSQGRLSKEQVERAVRSARIPPVPEIQEQFDRASRKLLAAL